MGVSAAGMGSGRRDSPCYNARPAAALVVCVVATDGEREMRLSGRELGGDGNDDRLAKGSSESNGGVGESRASRNGLLMMIVDPWPVDDGSGTLAGNCAVCGEKYG